MKSVLKHNIGEPFI